MSVRWSTALVLTGVLVASAGAVSAQEPQEQPYKPQVGQEGKDVVWVPTPQALVDKMLDLAKVTADDFVIDLGSGDGRTVITAAKRGARAHGIEYNGDMVELARRAAAEEGVSERATFEEADIFESDFSKAQVITMFLLPSLNVKLRPTLLELKPGTRIVSNTFTMDEWQADETDEVTEDCTSWCTALLWIVPAKVDGVWRTAQGELRITQEFQVISGTLGDQALTSTRLRGDEIAFTVGNVRYTGRVDGETIRGTMTGGGPWTATRR
jgi:SAM-dependent methyltransferase